MRLRVVPGNTADLAAFAQVVTPAIARLIADDGPLQMSLFDQQNLAEITHLGYPGERLVACRNPALAAERARKRGELLAATEPRFRAPGWPEGTRSAWPWARWRTSTRSASTSTSPSPTRR